jgi:hypothetical protein
MDSVAALIGRERVGGETVERPTHRALALAAPCLAVAFIPLFTNWSTASRAGQTDTIDFARDLLDSVEPYGVLVTVGDNDTFPLWYAQEVEGIRRDVVVANTSLLNTDWYTRQLIRRPVYEYDAAHGPSIYRGKSWKKPTSPLIQMTPEQADSVPAYLESAADELRERSDQGDDRSAAALCSNVLQRADIFVLKIIAESFQDPRSTSAEPRPATQRAGARELSPHAGPGDQGVHPTGRSWQGHAPRSGRGVDGPKRSGTNRSAVSSKSIMKRNDWIDRPSVGIPYLYVATGLMLSEVMQASGDTTGATRVLGESRRIAQAVRLDDLLAQMQEPPRPAGPVQNPLLTPTDTQQGQPLKR